MNLKIPHQAINQQQIYLRISQIIIGILPLIVLKIKLKIKVITNISILFINIIIAVILLIYIKYINS